MKIRASTLIAVAFYISRSLYLFSFLLYFFFPCSLVTSTPQHNTKSKEIKIHNWSYKLKSKLGSCFRVSHCTCATRATPKVNLCHGEKIPFIYTPTSVPKSVLLDKLLHHQAACRLHHLFLSVLSPAFQQMCLCMGLQDSQSLHTHFWSFCSVSARFDRGADHTDMIKIW